ncbi:MAG: patatin-like phospholipase family protein [Bacteroidetes bacterium]|nr:patatin-like phospholipase family protein [Bacteroidota bacterium]
MSSSKDKTGIVLCGGGVRGLAQIGVLAALEGNGIRPDYISGSSIGAVIGAFYAAGYSPLEMLEISKSSSMLKVFQLGFRKSGISNLKYLHNLLKRYLPGDSFESLKKQLFVCVSNLNTGKFEIRNSGKLYPYILASAAVPLVFEAQEIDGQLYVDGGLLNNFPLEPLEELCTKTIGIFVHDHRPVGMATLKNWQDIANRCLSLALHQNSKHNLASCNILIEPEKAYDYGVFRKKTDEELFRIGYDKTNMMMDDIKKAILS